MKVGITYDLREDYLKQGLSFEEAAEFDVEETIVAIAEALTEQGFTTQRIGNVYQVVRALSSGERFDFVFNIAEGRYGLARESQVPALLDAYQIPYVFSDPLTLAIALDKGMTKHILRDAGIKTAPFWVVNSKQDCEQVSRLLSYPVFAKPLAEGSSKGIHENSAIFSEEELWKVCANLLHRFKQPVLVEKFLSGREFTVGIVGTGDNAEVLGVMEIKIDSDKKEKFYCHSYKVGELCHQASLHLVNDEAAKQAATIALSAWKVLRCRDGGRVDVRCDEKMVPHILELNPLAGLRPFYSDLVLIAGAAGLSYQDLLKRIVDSALMRFKYHSTNSAFYLQAFDEATDHP